MGGGGGGGEGGGGDSHLVFLLDLADSYCIHIANLKKCCSQPCLY